ncbi:hypothetical protein [Salinithrix halophila]|uniref:Uncharacterized protein n=1 Tax=Salinithrix halophila TaxID=1485204 RepID=A0ABV8JAG2_9BACL
MSLLQNLDNPVVITLLAASLPAVGTIIAALINKKMKDKNKNDDDNNGSGGTGGNVNFKARNITNSRIDINRKLIDIVNNKLVYNGYQPVNTSNGGDFIGYIATLLLIFLYVNYHTYFLVGFIASYALIALLFAFPMYRTFRLLHTNNILVATLITVSFLISINLYFLYITPNNFSSVFVDVQRGFDNFNIIGFDMPSGFFLVVMQVIGFMFTVFIFKDLIGWILFHFASTKLLLLDEDERIITKLRSWFWRGMTNNTSKYVDKISFMIYTGIFALILSTGLLYYVATNYAYPILNLLKEE